MRDETEPFDLDEAIRRLREAVKPYAKAAMFELAAEGYDSPFEQLIACIISIRTFDEVMIETARTFFARARTPAEVSRLSPQEIDRMIRASTFHEGKAYQIHAIAERLVEEFGGEMP